MIIEAITLISTANAAISTIKEMVGNGQDLMSCGKQLSEYFGAKSEISKRVQEKGQSDLELFMANEELKQREQELKEMMIYQGRGGLWDDWLRFQADQKKARDAAAAEEKRKRMAKRKAIKNGLVIGGVVVLSLTAVGAGVLMLLWLLSMKER
jgi:hypothetical protein